MIRKLITALILVPLAVGFAAFAVANRQMVVISFDPFDQAHPAFVLSVPLFALILTLVLGGVVVGGVCAWVGERELRRGPGLGGSLAHRPRTNLGALKRGIG